MTARRCFTTGGRCRVIEAILWPRGEAQDRDGRPQGIARVMFRVAERAGTLAARPGAWQLGPACAAVRGVCCRSSFLWGSQLLENRCGLLRCTGGLLCIHCRGLSRIGRGRIPQAARPPVRRRGVLPRVLRAAARAASLLSARCVPAAALRAAALGARQCRQPVQPAPALLRASCMLRRVTRSERCSSIGPREAS